jgi:hypothetical protein
MIVRAVAGAPNGTSARNMGEDAHRRGQGGHRHPMRPVHRRGAEASVLPEVGPTQFNYPSTSSANGGGASTAPSRAIARASRTISARSSMRRSRASIMRTSVWRRSASTSCGAGTQGSGGGYAPQSASMRPWARSRPICSCSRTYEGRWLILLPGRPIGALLNKIVMCSTVDRSDEQSRHKEDTGCRKARTGT